MKPISNYADNRAFSRRRVLAGAALGLLAPWPTYSFDMLEKADELLDSLGSSSESGELTLGEISGGLKEALKVGTGNVVGQLGQMDGFNTDPQVHIPLPESLTTVQTTLEKLGMSDMLDELELKLNRAAEAATPKARKLFWNAIADMTLDDAKSIYEGPDDAATRYFQSRMSAPLAQEMTPVVRRSLRGVGALESYDRVMGEYTSLPFVPDVNADLTAHVVNRGMDGIFHYLAKEEAAIRQNPTKRTTALLQKVFGSS